MSGKGDRVIRYRDKKERPRRCAMKAAFFPSPSFLPCLHPRAQLPLRQWHRQCIVINKRELGRREKPNLSEGGGQAGRRRHPTAFLITNISPSPYLTQEEGEPGENQELPVKGNTSPPLYLPVLSDGRAGVGQSQVDLHVALLFRVAPHPCHEPLNSAVLRLEVEMR